jgi:hypothetical protein
LQTKFAAETLIIVVVAAAAAVVVSDITTNFLKSEPTRADYCIIF